MTEDASPPVGGYRDYARRAAGIYALSVLITAVVTVVAINLPIDLRPHLAISLVLGLLFGPFASLGADTVSLLTNLYNGQPLDLTALDLLTTFMISYVPYRMWYSSLLWGGEGDERPSLGTVRNVVKFILVMAASSVVYMVLYNYTYSLLYLDFDMGYDDLSILLSVISFSLIFGMAMIVVFRYMGVGFYSPHRMFQRTDARSRLGPRGYDVALTAGAVVWLAMLVLGGETWLYPSMALVYVLVLLFMTKPVVAYDEDDSARRIGRYGFNGSIIERIIVFFIVIGLAFGVASGLAAYYGVLSDVLGQGREMSTVFYMGGSVLAFFAVATGLLWYVERRVSVPLGDISEAARDFVGGERGSMDVEATIERYGRYADYDSEVGALARSLTEMTGDIEEYIEDIRSLSSAQERYLAELGVAKAIQESLIPKDFASVPDGVEVHGAMIAAKSVGGDLYDFFTVDDDHLAVAVADVSGKGMPAALFMAVTKSLMESLAGPGVPPEQVVSDVNASMCRNNDEGMFVTAWFGILELSTGTLSFVNAGHCAPVMTRRGSEPAFVRTKPGLVLGGLEGCRYRRETMVLEPGDRLVLYTDGVTEANKGYEEFYGEGRLVTVVGAHASDPLSDEVSAIVDDVLGFTGDSEQFDDITVLILEYRGTE